MLMAPCHAKDFVDAVPVAGFETENEHLCLMLVALFLAMGFVGAMPATGPEIENKPLCLMLVAAFLSMDFAEEMPVTGPEIENEPVCLMLVAAFFATDFVDAVPVDVPDTDHELLCSMRLPAFVATRWTLLALWQPDSDGNGSEVGFAMDLGFQTRKSAAAGLPLSNNWRNQRCLQPLAEVELQFARVRNQLQAQLLARATTGLARILDLSAPAEDAEMRSRLKLVAETDSERTTSTLTF